MDDETDFILFANPNTESIYPIACNCVKKIRVFEYLGITRRPWPACSNTLMDINYNLSFNSTLQHLIRYLCCAIKPLHNQLRFLWCWEVSTEVTIFGFWLYNQTLDKMMIVVLILTCFDTVM